jgi:hypothetical protein
VLSKSVNLDLIPENQTDFAFEQTKLRNTGKLTLSRAVSFKAEGIFPINCARYKVCVAVGGENYIGAEATCPLQQNFNPDSKQCDPDYICPGRNQAGFICLSNTSFTYFSDALEVIVSNVICPPNHFCNKVCKHPCIQFLYNC